MKSLKHKLVGLIAGVGFLAAWAAAPAQDIIVDNDSGAPAYSETGAWATSGSTGYNGGTYRYATCGGANTATWTAALPQSGDYAVSVFYRAGSNRASSAQYDVATAGGTQTVYVNQQANDLVWVGIGTWTFNAGNATITLDAAGSTPTGNVVIADAVRFTLDTGPTPTPTPSPTPSTYEFRALWADAWHGGFKTAAEVTALVNTARDHNYNAIIAQVRKRGDCYYFPTAPNTEPRATDIASGFDPLQELIDQAHPLGIEVHAWIVTNLIEDSSVSSDPAHVINAHPEYLMKTSSGATFMAEGYYLDPGNPAANQWNHNVVMDLVSHYGIDGIHFDYIRYPQEDSGYNDVSIARYNAEFGLSGQPAPSDSQFKAWRRRQITDWLRATYADIVAANPTVKVSAAVFASESDAVNYRFQDWPTWMNEQLLDALCPMNYASGSTYTSRADNANAKKNGRHCYMGQGAYLLAKEDTATQMLYARSIGCEGNITYSYAVTNSGADTNAAFYDYILANVHQAVAGTPDMPWKSAPTTGYLRGKVTDSTSGQPVYNADVTIVELTRTVKTDGEGKYAFVDVPPGTYTVTASGWGYGEVQNPGVSISAGAVTTSDFVLGTAATPTPSPSPTPATDIVVDNDDGSPAYTETGTWITSGSTGYNGGTYRYATATAANTATWSADLAGGDYEVSVIYVAGANRATSVKYNISTASGTQSVFIDQTVNNLVWVSLGTFTMNSGTNTVTLDASGSSPGATVCIADAVHFAQAGSSTPTPTATPSPSPSPTPTLTPSPSPSPSPAPGVVHVDGIVLTTGSQGKNTYATGVVTIKDANGDAVANATVDVSWSGLVGGSDSDVTAADGTVSFTSSKTKSSGTITLCVDNVASSGNTYDPGQNVETCDSVSVP